jgi:hypothetical protein
MALFTRSKIPGYKLLKKLYVLTKNALSGFVINFYLFKVHSKYLQNQNNKKVISFCLYGSSQKYFSNIAACIESYHEKFTGWIIRVYVSRDLPAETLNLLKQYGCELVIMDSSGIDHRYTFWRFLVLDDTDVYCALIRDIDSIASDREKTMVDRWLSSGKKLHIIRDHPSHIALIMAGLWGVNTHHIKQDVETKILKFKKLDAFGVDQDFLEMIYHQTFPDVYINDIYNRYANEQTDIIPHDGSGFFIGEINSAHPHKERHRKELADFYKGEK